MDIISELTSLETFTLTIIGESRGEPIEGQVAVGNVIRNRLLGRPDKYNGYKAVCLEPAQFSCWNLNDVNRKLLMELAQNIVDGQKFEDPVYIQCEFIAIGLMSNKLLDNTKGAKNYMTTDLLQTKPPIWAKNIRNISHFGQQSFFNV